MKNVTQPPKRLRDVDTADFERLEALLERSLSTTVLVA
jgi:hypothetical protein